MVLKRKIYIYCTEDQINLMELGFLPGKQLTLQHRAPSGGPLAFQLEETLLALRKNEAALIRIELLS
jgi:ferrous iron transport protein A